MDKLVFSCFLLGGITPDPGPTDSCALNAYCATGLTNVGCNPPPITGGTECDGLNAKVKKVLAAEKHYILDTFNYYRDTYASGLNGNPEADRMFPLRWDAKLATQAGHNARSCIIARDDCRNTADYVDVGQFIATYTSSPAFLAALTTSRKFFYVFNSNNDFSPYLNGAASFSSYSASTSTENEANILNDRSTKVGCALMEFDASENQITVYVVCNFSANVIEGQPIYLTNNCTYREYGTC